MREVQKAPHHHLIVSDEVRQLEALHQALWDEYSHHRLLPQVWVMTGKVTGKKRSQIKQEIIDAPAAIVFATVAKEGLDIPAIDRIYLPFPTRNPKKVQQWIGRGTRMFEGKDDTLIFDFHDIKCGVLKAQFRNRRFQCYDQLDIEVRLDA
jgi:superfamily II DNA or RNA helicase